MIKLGKILTEIRIIRQLPLKEIAELKRNIIKDYLEVNEDGQSNAQGDDEYLEIEYKIIQILPGYNKQKWEEYSEHGWNLDWALKLIQAADEIIDRELLK